MVFDPEQISYEEILKAFWEGHDPTQGMRQGNDARHPVPLRRLHDEPGAGAAAEASKAVFGERLKDRGYGDITTEVAEPASSTTPRTTTSSTSRRCPTATAAWAAPASPARSASPPKAAG